MVRKKNIYTWQDLVILAPMKDVEDLMRSLTIGGYHKSRQTSPTTNNARYWHQKYLHRLHKDLPLLPSLERKAIVSILSNSPKTTRNPHQTPPNVITVPFEQRLHSNGGRYKLVKPKQLETQKLSQKFKEMVKMTTIISNKPS